jgi:hypothetical protein
MWKLAAPAVSSSSLQEEQPFSQPLLSTRGRLGDKVGKANVWAEGKRTDAPHSPRLRAPNRYH